MKFYYVDDNYVNYLRAFEPKIPNLNYGQAHKDKFVCGVVLDINGICYYAPVFSNKTLYKTSFPILDSANNCTLSTLRLSFMFPVPQAVLTLVDFSQIKLQDINYYNLVEKERDYCLHNASKIKSKAEQVYRMGNNPNHFLNKTCCDFKLLETKYHEYCKSNNLT